jgi:hypothetical protein
MPKTSLGHAQSEEATFEAAWAEGQRMTLEAAVGIALAERAEHRLLVEG